MSTTTVASPLASEELARIDAYWRAANYLSVGQIHLLANALSLPLASHAGPPSFGRSSS